MTDKKPSFFYHGSVTPDIAELEPRRRYTPGAYEGKEILKSVYAGDDPAYCAAHAFPWGSDEGFELDFENGKVVLSVPEQFKERLSVRVYVYKLPGEPFELLKEVKPIGHNFATQEKVKPLAVEEFNSVEEAVNHYGGEVRYIKEK